MDDPYAPFEPATVCDPTEKPGSKAWRAWVLGEYGGNDLGIVRLCAGEDATSLHHEGRAWDWGPALNASGGFDAGALEGWQEDVRLLLAHLEDNADELARAAGLRVIIFDRRMWIAGQGWKNYGGSDSHSTHVHFGLSRAGAAGQTSLYRREGGVIRAIPLPLGGGAELGLASDPPPDTLTEEEMGSQVPKTRTPLTRQGLAEALAAGHVRQFGAPPSYERLGLAWSQVNHETGDTLSAYNFNWGNIKAFGWDGNYHLLTDDAPDEHFRAYPSAIEGAADYWRLLAARYPRVLQAFDRGNPAEAALELKKKGYYTAPESLYSSALVRHFLIYKSHFPKAGVHRQLAPLLAWMVVAGALWLK